MVLVPEYKNQFHPQLSCIIVLGPPSYDGSQNISKKNEMVIMLNVYSNQIINKFLLISFKFDARSRNASTQYQTVLVAAQQIPNNVSPLGYPFRNNNIHSICKCSPPLGPSLSTSMIVHSRKTVRDDVPNIALNRQSLVDAQR